MLTIQDWLDAGYKRYDNHKYKNADFLLQKRFDDSEGKKYFIDVWVYEYSKYEYYSRNPAFPPVGFQPEVQFQRGDKMTLDITFIMNQDSTIAEIEQEELWVGTEYFEGDKVEVQVSDYVNIHGIVAMLEQFDDWVYEDVGEIADCDFYNVSKEAKEELQELIQTWAEKHVKLPYWKVQNVVKKVVTQDDLE